jgi:hypothetical protein
VIKIPKKLNDTIEMVCGEVRNFQSAAAPPAHFIALCEEIHEFVNSPEGKPSNIISETVQGVHSWSAAVGKDGVRAGWQTVFADRLRPFRRMFAENPPVAAATSPFTKGGKIDLSVKPPQISPAHVLAAIKLFSPEIEMASAKRIELLSNICS